MGWNRIYDLKGDIFDTRQEEAYVYYVHSFYVEEGPYTVGMTDYVHPFSAAVQKDNFYATQFHVEKSGSIGEQILRNFINL
jgi:glutamine amidotransferase